MLESANERKKVMYCIKCGKSTEEETIVCDDCIKQSGFKVKQKEDIDNNRKYGRYFVLIGHLCILIGMFASFILIKPDAPEDFVAKIFKEKTLAPVKTESTEEEGTTEEEEKEELLEEIGYSYSIMSYLTRQTVSEENEKDNSILRQVSEYVNKNNMVPLDLSNEDAVKKIEAQFGSEGNTVIETLERYKKVNVQGVFVVIISIISMLAAIWLATKNDFGWSMLFSLIATCPVWMLIIRLNGINAWEFQNGLYFFIFGIFAVLVGGMVGGNVDSCPECKTVLPGGAGYCFKCANRIVKEQAKSPKQIESNGLAE